MAARRTTASLGLALEGRTPWLTYAHTLLDRSGCQIRAYSKGMIGTAYCGPGWWIKVPRPRDPISFVIFAHEVGHHMLGHLQHLYAKPRYIEEQEAWLYALGCFDEFGLQGRRSAELRAQRSMGYALGKRARRLKGEVTIERFPGVNPLFDDVLYLTVAAGPERRFYWWNG